MASYDNVDDFKHDRENDHRKQKGLPSVEEEQKQRDAEMQKMMKDMASGKPPTAKDARKRNGPGGWMGIYE